MELVDTILGPIERERLEVQDLIEEGPNYRTIVTEWRLNGEIVKRDAATSILHGLVLGGEQAHI